MGWRRVTGLPTAEEAFLSFKWATDLDTGTFEACMANAKDAVFSENFLFEGNSPKLPATAVTKLSPLIALDEDEVPHWKLDIVTVDFLGLAHFTWFSPLEAFTLMSELPVSKWQKQVLTSDAHEGGLRQFDYQIIMDASLSWAAKKGFQAPKTRAEHSKLVEKMDFEVACMNFPTGNPDWFNDLPDIPGSDVKESFCLMENVDPRFSFPTNRLHLEFLPV